MRTGSCSGAKTRNRFDTAGSTIQTWPVNRTTQGGQPSPHRGAAGLGRDLGRKVSREFAHQLSEAVRTPVRINQ
jgi:hypothetical protein